MTNTLRRKVIHVLEEDGRCQCGFTLGARGSVEERLQGYAILRGDLAVYHAEDDWTIQAGMKCGVTEVR